MCSSLWQLSDRTRFLGHWHTSLAYLAYFDSRNERPFLFLFWLGVVISFFIKFVSFGFFSLIISSFDSFSFAYLGAAAEEEAAPGDDLAARLAALRS